MLCAAIRKPFPLCAAVFAASLWLLPQTAFAQVATDVPSSAAEDLRREVDELQDEVTRLRERDTERQTGESSVMERLPVAASGGVRAQAALQSIESMLWTDFVVAHLRHQPTE